jgi:glycerophosphoryl diester phosphodiesterase
MLAACRGLGARYVHPCFRPAAGFAPLVDVAHAAGLRVMTPHTNDPAEAQHFADLGVDVIASDDPTILCSLRSRAQASGLRLGH